MNATSTQGKSLLELAQLGYDVTLQNIKSQRIRDIETGWGDWQYQLTDKDIEDIANLLGGRYATRIRISTKLNYLSSLPSFWAFDRIHFCKHSKRWAYAAGQDYPSELSAIRHWFLNL
jgi:hypothetical protein